MEYESWEKKQQERDAPYDNEHFDIQDIDITREEGESLVGRVILQKGLVGALVLSYSPDDEKKTPFKIKLADGSTAYARYRKSYIWIDEPTTPAGIAEDGWYVPELGIKYDQRDVPF